MTDLNLATPSWLANGMPVARHQHPRLQLSSRAHVSEAWARVWRARERTRMVRWFHQLAPA